MEVSNLNKPVVIAYYLPQFHPFKENDEWWGKGFTEWTNVGKAKKLFPGHDQPKVPADLGYYDLRVEETRIQQAELAKEAGVTGFCYWHYWFGNGKQLMNRIIDEVHQTRKPDFPFCLGWANESWKSKLWRFDGVGDKLLIEQIYGGVDDYRIHFDYVKELFKDERYIRVNGCPLFHIYKPESIPNLKVFIDLWNKWVKEEGIAEKIYFVGGIGCLSDYDRFLKAGVDSFTLMKILRQDYEFLNSSGFIKKMWYLWRRFSGLPVFNSMKKINKYIWIDDWDAKDENIPFLLPCWDHTPRSGKKGSVIFDSTPKLFEEQATLVFSKLKKKKNKIVFLKSWNEWGEGNYIEPDLKWGKGYITALKNAISKYTE